MFIIRLIEEGGKKVFIVLGQLIYIIDFCVYNSKLNKFNKYWNSQRGKEKDNIVDVEYVGKSQVIFRIVFIVDGCLIIWLELVIV